MKTDIYNWHPKYKPYQMPAGDLILLSDTEQLLLTLNTNPLLRKIDGIQTLEDISRGYDAHITTMFFYYVRKLTNKGILLNSLTNISNRNLRATNGVHLLYDKNKLTTVNISYLDEHMARQWLTAVQSVFDRIASLNESLCCLLVDDFLDDRIIAIFLKHDTKNLLIIKVTGDRFIISPLFSKNQKQALINLQNQILENQPIRKFISDSNGKAKVEIPVVDALSLKSIGADRVKSILENQFNGDNKQLIIIDSENESYHPVNLFDNNRESSAHQPIMLKSCISKFNEDGGFRSVTPRQTVENLQQLVSPVTGIVSDVEPLTPPGEGSITIFRSRFYKAPIVDQHEPLAPEQFVQACLGKGLSKWQSQASAICEALERYSALFRGDEPYELCTQSELNGSSLAYSEFNSYSQDQYRRFVRNETIADSLHRFAVDFFSPDISSYKRIHWAPTWSISSKKQVYVPLSLCYANVPIESVRYGRWDSNGCAAGNTIEESILQGLLEVIERDAVAIWWYNKIQRPAFDLTNINNEQLGLISSSIGSREHYWVLDVTHDIGVPVMAAVAQNKSTGKFTLGFGCHIEPKLAAQRALLELCQVFAVRKRHSAPFDFDAIQSQNFLRPDQTKSPAAKKIIHASGDMKTDIESIVERLKSLNHETLVLDYNRVHIPLKTTKVLVPGLCHIWPQLGNERLYTIPIKMRWMERPNDETTINQQGLYL